MVSFEDTGVFGFSHVQRWSAAAYDDSQLTLMTDDILTKCEMLRFG